MNIGDKVRELHGRNEGIVVAILPNGKVQVELTDGFNIPFFKKELVVVSQMEEKIFAENETESTSDKPTKAQIFAERGIYLAKTLVTNNKHRFHLINNSDFQLLYTSFLLQNSKELKPLQAGILNRKTALELFQTEQASILTESKIIIQILFFSQGRSEMRLPLTGEIELKLANWKAEASLLPVLGVMGTKWQLDNELKKADAQALGTKLSESLPAKSQVKIEKVNAELDLHIDKLTDKHSSFRPDEIFRFQMRAFENHLEKAVSAGLKEVIYIHGVGSGILKDEIRKKLSNNMFVKYFEDAPHQKYGHGAVKVFLK